MMIQRIIIMSKTIIMICWRLEVMEAQMRGGGFSLQLLPLPIFAQFHTSDFLQYLPILHFKWPPIFSRFHRYFLFNFTFQIASDICSFSFDVASYICKVSHFDLRMAEKVLFSFYFSLSNFQRCHSTNKNLLY